MTEQHDKKLDVLQATAEYLRSRHGSNCDEANIQRLARIISFYVRRSKLPESVAIPKITTHFLQDGPLVHTLLSDPDAQEWQIVLEQVITFATGHSYYPSSEDAVSWPDLDAYEDIRQKLPSYNFEGPLYHWVNVAVVRRLSRFWRDRQSLRSGGRGFSQSQEQLNKPRINHISLDTDIDSSDMISSPYLETDPDVVPDAVEAIELEHLVKKAVDAYATDKFDPTLPALWHALADKAYKLREIAEELGLTIGQVYHRYLSLRAHLRADHEIAKWFDER